MTVRRRVDGDLQDCVAALREVRGSDGYPVWWPADPAAWLVPDGTLAGWVAEVGGAVVGHVCLVTGAGNEVLPEWTEVPAERLAHVSRLYVAPRGRGRGLGADLLRAVSAHAADHGLHVVLDVVEGSTAAVRLYEQLGWRLLDRRPAGWVAPSGERPLIRVYVGPGRGR